MLRLAPRGGGVIEAALLDSTLQARPVRMGDHYAGTDRAVFLAMHGRSSDDALQLDPNREEALERLRSLGYIR